MENVRGSVGRFDLNADKDLLSGFPGHTEADLFLWTLNNSVELEELALNEN